MQLAFTPVQAFLARGSCFVPEAPVGLGKDGITVPDPKSAALVIFLHGSETEDQTDLCNPRPGRWTTTPPVISALSAEEIAGKRVLVFAVCTCVDPVPGMVIGTGDQTKMSRRFDEIASLIDQFAAAGYERRYMFFAGHSAGAWVSLWFLAHNPGAYAGVIGFAPAGTGMSGAKPPGWDHLRQICVNGMSAAEQLPSLVYAFTGDEFESVEDLAFLTEVEGVRFVRYEGRRTKMLPNLPLLNHCTAYHKRFVKERETILNFITDRLAGGQGEATP